MYSCITQPLPHSYRNRYPYISIEGEDAISETDEESPEKMYNALADLWSRFEAEKKHLLQNLKGIKATNRDGIKVYDSIMWYLKKKVPL